jgi:hypothetical protein
MAARHFPKSMHAQYFGLHAFFLEVLRSREISREQSICQTRLHWWRATIDDLISKPDYQPREPITALLKHA